MPRQSPIADKPFGATFWNRVNIGRMVLVVLIGLNLTLLEIPTAQAQKQSTQPAKPKSQNTTGKSKLPFVHDICQRIEKAALLWNLPPGFFARLIWTESRFNPNAVSPVGASGIAQFMPGTAKIRKLKDPFDANTALPASAHYLSDLRAQFGNLGLAAAAYNAGENRVKRWQRGASGLPRETRNYVATITGISAPEWNREEVPKTTYKLDDKLSFFRACIKLPIRRSRLRPKLRLKLKSASWQPWGGHVTADWSQSKALAHYAKLQSKFPRILKGYKPMVLRVINPRFGRAPRFEIRIGQPNRAKAKAFCGRLIKAGGACLVTKTERQ